MEPLTTMGSVSAIDGAIKKKQKTKQNKKKTTNKQTGKGVARAGKRTALVILNKNMNDIY